MQRWLKGTTLGLLTGLGGLALGLSPVGHGLETNTGLAWLFHLRGPVAPPPDVVVIGINARTPDRLGLPSATRDWPRSMHASLVQSLVLHGADTIVFDIFFQSEKEAGEDAALVAAVDAADRVVLVEKLTGKKQPIQDLSGRDSGFVWIEELVPPFAALTAAARGVAPFPLPKIDAAVYEFWTFKDSVGDAPTMPAMALQVHARSQYEQWRQLLVETLPALDASLPPQAGDLNSAQSMGRAMQVMRRALVMDPSAADRLLARARAGDSQGGAAGAGSLLAGLTALYAGDAHRFINFYGPPGTVRTIPYESIISGEDANLSAEDWNFTGKTVFVGFSDLYDPGQPDRFYTVYTGADGVDLSGVEIAATAFANLLTDQALKPLDASQTAGLLMLFGALLAAAVYFVPAAVGVPLALALAAGYTVLCAWLFTTRQIWLPLSVPLLVQLPVALLLGLLGQYLFERRRGQHISEAISYYLPENIVRQLTESRLDPSATNRVVFSTCLATDMAGFSTLAEKLPPDQLASFLNEYFEALAQPLKNHRVDVTEFRADAIMCAWTSPQPDISVRSKAVYAALEAVDAVEAFKARHQNLGTSVRIGLECGTVYVGHAGGGGHFVYSIVGDCANTASRIESLNKHLGTRLLATQSVVEGLEDRLLLRHLGRFQFVGKSEGLPIVEIQALKTEATAEQQFLCEQFAQALAVFHDGQWGEARQLFGDVLRIAADDGPARFFQARCLRHESGELVADNPSVVRMDAK